MVEIFVSISIGYGTTHISIESWEDFSIWFEEKSKPRLITLQFLHQCWKENNYVISELLKKVTAWKIIGRNISRKLIFAPKFSETKNNYLYLLRAKSLHSFLTATKCAFKFKINSQTIQFNHQQPLVLLIDP